MGAGVERGGMEVGLGGKRERALLGAKGWEQRWAIPMVIALTSVEAPRFEERLRASHASSFR